jgi:PAS domain S-box-containing protein
LPGDRFIELAQSEDRHVLDVLFRHAREAVTVQDQSGQLVYANDRAADLVGMESGAEMMATPVTEIVLPFDMIDETGSPITATDLPARRVLAGLAAHEMTVGFRSHDSKTVRWTRVNSSPIKDDAGNVVWAVNFMLDVTDDVRERESERFLALLNEALVATVRIDESLRAVVELLAVEIGSWCGVHIVDHRGDLVLRAASNPESGDPPPFGVDDDSISLGSNRLQARVMKTRLPEVEVDVAADPSRVRDEGATSSGVNAGSVACVPVGSGTVAGTLTVARSRAEATFDSTDLVLLRRVSGVVSVALANARLYELEHETAEALRAGLTPSVLPEWEGFELAARYVPLERFGHVGGDFFDIVPLSGSRRAVVVGDIEGKGVPAAAAVGVARDTIRATVKLDSASDVVLSQLNDALLEQESPRMCTVAYLRVERTTSGTEAVLALAGHPPPALLGPDGELSFLGTPCPPAGVLPSIQPHDTELSLSPGDTLLFYTDGFALPTEAPMETVARFIEGGQLEDLDHLLDRMLHDLRANVEVFRDDVLLLALRAT